MSVQLDEHAYQRLIDENIIALEKYMPEHSLEKKHTIEVLKWSVNEIYHNTKLDVSKMEANDVSKIVKLYIEFLRTSGETKLQNQIDFVEYLNNNLIKTPIFISIINSLKELQSIKNSRNYPDCPLHTSTCHWDSFCPKNVKCLLKE
jgi:hypothetical protein